MSLTEFFDKISNWMPNRHETSNILNFDTLTLQTGKFRVVGCFTLIAWKRKERLFYRKKINVRQEKEKNLSVRIRWNSSMALPPFLTLLVKTSNPRFPSPQNVSLQRIIGSIERKKIFNDTTINKTTRKKVKEKIIRMLFTNEYAKKKKEHFLLVSLSTLNNWRAYR